MIVLTFQFAAVGVVSWTADQDYTLEAASLQSTAVNAGTFSTRPDLTNAILAARSTGWYDDLLLYFKIGSLNQSFVVQDQLKIPIVKDTTYYANWNAGVAVLLLYLEPVSAE